jgi:hypothetical protein
LVSTDKLKWSVQIDWKFTKFIAKK